MKISFMGLFVAACLAGYAQQPAAAPSAAEQPAANTTPSIDTVSPSNGKVGTVITATGQNLQKASVAKVYLTDDKTDLQVDVTEQTATTIKFKIPDKAAGRMSLMVLTQEKDPKLMVLPVKVTIDD
ncbi:MAG TPA: IPT/TIG domain-containing protein [Bryobacteraceae bacterium]|nr:IPT/TIG domain-containing protein [Bryobacteraceae bacterium]